MGWRVLFVALCLAASGRTHGARRGNHKVNVVVITTLGRIMPAFTTFLSTA